MTPFRLLLGLAVLDVLFFGAWIGREEFVRRNGLEVKLPLEGYDPRDLLRGQYVRFRLVAEREAEDGGFRLHDGESEFCLEEREGLWHVNPSKSPGECRVTILGKARDGRIRFGIERFYVDERRANEVQSLQADADTYLIAHLDANGGIHPKELVVAGRPFSAKPQAATRE